MKLRLLACVFALIIGCGEDGGANACEANVCQCTEDGIRAAIAQGGGPFTFDCDGPTTVVTDAEIVIDNDVILDAGGNLTVDGNEDHRVFSVLEGATTTNASTGIQNFGTLVVTDSDVSNHTGDGVQSLINNVGLPNERVAVATVLNSRLSKNGYDGFASQGEASLMNSIVSNNGLRGIANQGNVAVTNCTVSGNIGSVDGSIGSGVENLLESQMVLVNTTVSGNHAIGVFNARVDGKVTLVNSTVTDHSVADIANNGDATLVNTIVAGSCDPDAGGFITSGGHNVESPGQTCGLNTDGTDVDDVGTEDLKLGRLQDNGGPTETHALGQGSVAINVIRAADCLDAEGEPLTTDQRSEARPGGTMCDAGAFEVEP